MSLKYLLAAASMAVLLGVGTSARALETEIVYSGTVSDYTDDVSAGDPLPLPVAFHV